MSDDSGPEQAARPATPIGTNPIRPYVITGGRTRSAEADLPIETVVELAPHGHGPAAHLEFERAAIADLCAEPLSIAELASALDLPLGVTRVLASDLVSEGVLQAHGPATAADTGFIEQMIEGIRAL